MWTQGTGHGHWPGLHQLPSFSCHLISATSCRTPPLDPIVHEIPDRIEHRPVAVRLRPAAPTAHPARHRQQRPDLGPLRVRHVRGTPPNTFRVIGRIPEPVSDTITRGCRRVEPHRRQYVQLRQQGLLDLGWLRNPELPRGPVPMPTANCDHPIETPVRRTSLKIGTTTASDRPVQGIHHAQVCTTAPGLPGSRFHRGKTRRRTVSSHNHQVTHHSSMRGQEPAVNSLTGNRAGCPVRTRTASSAAMLRTVLMASSE